LPAHPDSILPLIRLYAASPDPTFIVESASSHVFWVNPAFCAATGLAEAEVVGRDLSCLRPDTPTARDDWRPGALAAREGRPGRFDIPCRRMDGSPLIIDITFLPIMEADGSQRFVIGAARDVTRTRQLTREIQEREKRFQDFAEIASDWFWELDESLRFSWVSVPGIPVSAYAGKTFRETQPIMAEAVLAAHEDDLAHRRPFRNLAFARLTPDGTQRFLSSSGRPVFDETGRFRGYRGCAQDITANLETERRLLSAIESMRDGLILFDRDDRVVLHNTKYLDLYPYARQLPGIIGLRFEELLRQALQSQSKDVQAAHDPEAWVARRVARHLDPPAEPYEVQLSDGRWLLVHERRTAEGGIVGIRSDITRMKRAELDAKSAHAMAEAHNRAKSDFLANMSHELRTPLNAIIGFSETMSHELLGPIGSVRYREYAEDIRKSGAYLLDLIGDILDLSRIEAGKRELSAETFVFAELGTEVLRMMRETAMRAKVSFASGIDPGLPAVTLDRRAVRQILLNLLSNAIKFSPAGGTVRLTAAEEHGGFTFAVADEGPGIPADRVSSLAQPFVQVENVMNRRLPGSGLGLAISRSLAELHGGSLRIDSVLGQGTRVSIHLPLAVAAAAA